ncbi:hypothetical protein NR800_18100 [Corallococcus interemptor]|uniref:hypothetical protein n=1 Tax=Corallococcus TaxID=83461 RepID=UPI001CBB76FF|nr:MULTISPECIES: hypothetical protein [unclassified Corallococcus]MBZ4332976.1 hypothetical protein [Corallococcus sp. AS-1-12]MBZ4373783.1 hypothetical protein [Corallococcus sp. AS-1-6]
MPERSTGYLASLINFPPLIFRFQFNPEMLQEKKTYKYQEANGFGQWGADQFAAATGFFSSLGGLNKDVKEIGALLANTKPLEPVEGEQRTFALDFKLNATMPGPLDGSQHYADLSHPERGSLEPDLALLRSFMNPSWDIIDVGKALAGSPSCWKRPPECSLIYGGLSVTCVMTDLNIKMVEFFDDGKPSRADVTVSLKEQTFSAGPVVDYFKRAFDVGRSYVRPGIGTDFAAVTPIVNLFV